MQPALAQASARATAEQLNRSSLIACTDYMKPLPASVALLIAIAGPARPTLAQQPELVRLAQHVPVSLLDPTCPAIAFERWLAQVAGRSPAAIRWEVNDCGEGGDGLAAPTCVEAVVALVADTTAQASLVVAGIDGTATKPAIWLLSATAGNSVTTYKSLSAWAAWVRRHAR